jgi:hypothetical protein
VTELGLVIFAIMLAVLPTAQAHRLDDLMQASFIEIKPEEIRIQLNLNPGVAVADKVIWMMDRDGDGAVSDAEEIAFSKLVKKQLKISIDSQTLPLEILNMECDGPADLRSGNGDIHIELAARLPHLLPGVQRLRFENNNLPGMSAYLVNATMPEDPTIRISKQLRNENQSVCWISFLAEPSKRTHWAWAFPFFTIGSAGVVGLLIVSRKLSAKKMAGVAGLEPVTSAVTGQRSNQLSYTPA